MSIVTSGADNRIGLSYGKARIIGLKNEDRDHIHLHEEQNLDDCFGDVPSFAVFDGHGGEKSANICEEKLYAATKKSYSRSTAMLSSIAAYPAVLRDEDIVDTFLVKAIHDGVEAVHEASVKESETAGTTLCSLFLVPVDHQKHVHGMRQSDPWQPPQADVAAAEMGVAADCGRSYKVLCANIGDSRCVMVGCSAEPASDFEANLRRSRLSTMASPDEKKSSSRFVHGCNFAWRRSFSKLRVSVKAIPMSEDHKPSNKRERYRVEQRLKIGQQVLPVPLKAFDQSDEDFVQLYQRSSDGSNSFRPGNSFVAVDSTVEDIKRHLRSTSYPLYSLKKDISYSTDILGINNTTAEENEFWSRYTNQLLVDPDSAVFGGNITDEFLYRLYAATKLLEQIQTEDSAENRRRAVQMQDTVTTLTQIIRTESRFMPRISNYGVRDGPEAYFPRSSNNSLMMTRTIGDKNGPRGCLATADITSVTVHSTQHARFVLATDGVWDVIDEEYIRKFALYSKYKDPKDLALFLAHKAAHRRTKRDLARDDITVLVIDVNPQNAVFIHTARSHEGRYYHATEIKNESDSSPQKSILTPHSSPPPSPTRSSMYPATPPASEMKSPGAEEDTTEHNTAIAAEECCINGSNLESKSSRFRNMCTQS